MTFFKESEMRRVFEKNAFIVVLGLSGLALMGWTKSFLDVLVNANIPVININIATVLGATMIYLGYRYLKGRI